MWLSTEPPAYETPAAPAAPPLAEGVPGVDALSKAPLRQSKLFSWFFRPLRLAVTYGSAQ